MRASGASATKSGQDRQEQPRLKRLKRCCQPCFALSSVTVYRLPIILITTHYKIIDGFSWLTLTIFFIAIKNLPALETREARVLLCGDRPAAIELFARRRPDDYRGEQGNRFEVYFREGVRQSAATGISPFA